MEKNEKKVLNAVICIMLVFILSIAIVSYIGRTERQVKNHAQITIGEAREIALNDAKSEEAKVAFTKQERDREHGIYTYEIEFNDGLTRYEYEIDAQTGEIISRFSVLMR